jgi:hypothetical protein
MSVGLQRRFTDLAPMAAESKTRKGFRPEQVNLKNGNPVRLPAGNQSNPIDNEEDHYVQRNQMAMYWDDGNGVVDCGRYVRLSR